MTIALLNTTPIVGKLVERLAQKRGDLLYRDGVEDGRKADVVIVDDSVAERYDAESAKGMGYYALYIGSRFDTMPRGYDAVIGKPFLPEELSRVLNEAELSVSAVVERNDIFDADEAASSWESESAEEERPVFDRTEIDELKELLNAVEREETEGETESATLEQQIESALETLQSNDWEQPVEEVLYEAGSGVQGPEAETDAVFEGIDLHARGVEALQDLMAILSDESVARALKAMGVRIDISFGEKV